MGCSESSGRVQSVTDEWKTSRKCCRLGNDFVRWRHLQAIVHASTIITVPQMGDSVTEGTIATILKEAGASKVFTLSASWMCG